MTYSVKDENAMNMMDLLLVEWNLSELIPDFQDKGIDIEVLKELTVDDINRLIPDKKFGLRIKFRTRFLEWKRKQQNEAIIYSSQMKTHQDPEYNVENLKCKIAAQRNTQKQVVIHGNIVTENTANNYEYNQQSSIQTLGELMGVIIDDDLAPAFGRATERLAKHGKQMFLALDEVTKGHDKILEEYVESTLPKQMNILGEVLKNLAISQRT